MENNIEVVDLDLSYCTYEEVIEQLNALDITKRYDIGLRGNDPWLPGNLPAVLALLKRIQCVSLDFGDNTLKDEKVIIVTNFAIQKPELEKLNFTDCLCGPKALIHICHTLVKHPGLKELDLQVKIECGKAEVNALVNLITQNHTLTSLLLSNLDMDEMAVNTIIEALKQNTSLEEFILWDSVDTDQYQTINHILLRNKIQALSIHVPQPTLFASQETNINIINLNKASKDTDSDSSDSEIDEYISIREIDATKTMLVRGTHFNTEFFNREKRNEAKTRAYHNTPDYSNATKKLAEQLPRNCDNTLNYPHANELVIGYFKLLKLTPDKRERDENDRFLKVTGPRAGGEDKFINLYYRFIQAYINSYEKVFIKHGMTRNFNFYSNYNPIVSTLPVANISNIEKYIMGSEINPIAQYIPKLKINGTFKHRRFGYIHIYALDANDYNVYAVRVGTLAERQLINKGARREVDEVFFESSIPTECILGYQLFSLPKFKKDWAVTIENAFGLNQATYNHYKTQLRNQNILIIKSLMELVAKYQLQRLHQMLARARSNTVLPIFNVTNPPLHQQTTQQQRQPVVPQQQNLRTLTPLSTNNVVAQNAPQIIKQPIIPSTQHQCIPVQPIPLNTNKSIPSVTAQNTTQTASKQKWVPTSIVFSQPLCAPSNNQTQLNQQTMQHKRIPAQLIVPNINQPTSGTQNITQITSKLVPIPFHQSSAKNSLNVLLKCTEQVEATSKNVAHEINPEALKVIFKWVTEGHLVEVKKCLDKNPKLAFATGTIIDRSDRIFKGITILQYAAWALDIEMCNVIIPYIDQENKMIQLNALSEEPEEYGVNGKQYDMGPLITHCQTYIDNYDKWSYSRCHYYWQKEVGGEQRKCPAWLIYAWSEEGQDVAWVTENFSRGFNREYDKHRLEWWFTESYYNNGRGVGSCWAVARGSLVRGLEQIAIVFFTPQEELGSKYDLMALWDMKNHQRLKVSRQEALESLKVSSTINSSNMGLGKGPQ